MEHWFHSRFPVFIFFLYAGLSLHLFTDNFIFIIHLKIRTTLIRTLHETRQIILVQIYHTLSCPVFFIYPKMDAIFTLHYALPFSSLFCFLPALFRFLIPLRSLFLFHYTHSCPCFQYHLCYNKIYGDWKHKGGYKKNDT